MTDVEVRALRESLESAVVDLDYRENVDIEYVKGDHSNSYLGRTVVSLCMLASELNVNLHRKRVGPGGEVRFLIEPRMQHDCTSAAVEGIARVAHAQIDLFSDNRTRNLAYSVVVCVDTDSRGTCIEIVVLIPADAMPGSEVIVYYAELGWRAATCHWVKRLCESSSDSTTSRHPQAGCTRRHM
jgi:hypothetical protein